MGSKSKPNDIDKVLADLHALICAPNGGRRRIFERAGRSHPRSGARAMANHASTRTTQLYNRRNDRATLDDVELIRLG